MVSICSFPFFLIGSNEIRDGSNQQPGGACGQISSYSSLRLISGDEIYARDGKIISEEELYQILYGMTEY